MESVIFEDCINLIEKFTENENPHFESFCIQFKSMMFMHVYSAQTSVIEVIQTTKAILHLAKRIICAKDEVGKVVAQMRDCKQQILRRIGGMYLLYAIYFKQPTKEYVRVYVCPETWQEISSFIQNLPTDPQMDEVRYIFWRLYRADAFRFTALDYELGLENMVDYDKIYDIHRGREKAEVVRVKLKLKLQAIAEAEKILPEMVELEDKYNNIKKSLSGSQKSIKQNALPSTNIFHDIQDVIRNIHDILDDKTEEDTPATSKSSIAKDGNINEIRKELKRKAAGLIDNSLENEESNDDNESAVEESPAQSVRKKIGKMSSRTMIETKLPDDIMDDLEKSSSEEQDDEEEQNISEEEEQDESENDEVDFKMASSPQNILPI